MASLVTIYTVYDLGAGSYEADVDIDFGGEIVRSSYGVTPTDTAPIAQAIRDAITAGSVVPEAPSAATEPFPKLSRVQLLLGLVDLSKTEADVDTIIAAMSEPDKTDAQIRWKNGTIFARDDALVVALIPSLGLTDAAVDPVWRTAATY